MDYEEDHDAEEESVTEDKHLVGATYDVIQYELRGKINTIALRASRTDRRMDTLVNRMNTIAKTTNINTVPTTWPR
jgi:hypothetical protein